MDLSRIDDSCLKNGFKLNTNLSEVKGCGIIRLIESLNHVSMNISNMRIIERVLYQNPGVFKTSESIKEIMRKNEPVINAFTKLGIYDKNCNIGWLIKTLNAIHEIRPLRDLLVTGPPTITMKHPNSVLKISPGQKIELEVRTISDAYIQWWKHYEGRAEIVQDHIQINGFSASTLSYKTRESDIGYFYIEVICKGKFREMGDWIYVGNDVITDDERESYESLNRKKKEDYPTKELPTERENEICQEIVPSQESDGIKRVALLIGVLKYKDLILLKAPETDILDLERVLLDIGFTVFCFGDLTKIQLTKILVKFSQDHIDVNTNVFFYFAGHGNSKNHKDHLQLLDDSMMVIDVLNALNHKKPKVLVSIFDMCRDDTHQGNNDNKLDEGNNDNKLDEACIPLSDNLILVMSTLPKKQSFEKSSGLENSSLIMKPLCDNLRRFGSRHPINLVLANFINTCENIVQRPNIAGVGIPDIIGIDMIIPKIKPKLEWINIPADQSIMRYIIPDFKVFHNYLNIHINSNLDQKIYEIKLIEIIHLKEKHKIEKETDGNYKINLFQYPNLLDQKMGVFIHFYVLILNKMRSITAERYEIKIEIPDTVFQFIKVFS